MGGKWGIRDEEGEEGKVVEVAAAVFLGYGVGLWGRGGVLVKSAGGALVKYLDVAVPDFVARGGRAGSVVPNKFSALFNCAEDGVLLLELSPHRKKSKVSQPHHIGRSVS